MSFSQIWEKDITLTGPRICYAAGGIAVFGSDGSGQAVDVYSTSGSRSATYRGDPGFNLDSLFDTIPYAGGVVVLGTDPQVLSHDGTARTNAISIIACFVEIGGGSVAFGDPVSVGNLHVWDETGAFVDSTYVGTLDIHAATLHYDGALVSDGTILQSVMGGIEADGGSGLRPIHIDVVTLALSGSSLSVDSHETYVSTIPEDPDSPEADTYIATYVLPWGNRAAGAHLLVDGTVEYISEKAARYRCNTSDNTVLAPGDGPVGTVDNTGDFTPVVDDISSVGLVKHYEYTSAS
jgi:hypothetical protein